jgi:prepilin-type processing-associated H-X9-DG protein
MATYVNDLRLKEIGTGESSGTWGTETNTNLELIGEALGFGTEAITTNADTHTTTVADGSTDPGRAMYLKYTGTLDSACTITIAPNTMSRMHFIENGTSGSQNIIISQGTGANVTIPAGDVKAVYLDGAGSGAAVADAFASLNVVDLKVEDDLTVTDDLIVNGDIDLEGSIDVNGTANLDVVDIDGAVDMASTLQVDGSITSSDGATITTADNTDTLSLISTDADANTGPNLRLYRNSGSPADDDVTGVVTFTGRNDNSEDVIYARQLSYVKDASDGTEDGQMTLQTMVAGTIRDRLNITPSEIVLNEDSVDVNLRVESNGEANMLFVDGGNDHVIIGAAAIDTAGSVGFTTDGEIRSVCASGVANDHLIGAITGVSNGFQYTQDTSNNQTYKFHHAGNVTLTMSASEVAFNEGSVDQDFRVESNGQANMLFVDGGNDVVTIGGATFETADTFCVREAGANSVNTRFVNSNDDANGVHVILDKSSSSPADNDELGQISFFGKDDAGNSNTFAAIQVFADDVSNASEDGIMTLSTAVAGTFTEQFRIGPTGTIINKSSAIAVESGLGVFGIHNTDNNRAVLQMQCENAQSTGVYAQSAYYNGSALGTLEQHTGDGATDSGLIKWFTTPTGGSTTERMRITSGGTICIGTTSASGTSAMDIRQVNNQVIRSESTGSGSVVHVQFVKTSGGTAQIGDITGTTSSVSYNSGSDYRLKENVITDWDATTLLKQLKPSKFNFKDNVSETVTGFIAHEVQEVLPYLVSGEKDGENMQTMDYAKLTPLLTKAIQELETRVATLEG